MAEVKCHGCNQMVLLYQGVCTECETVVVAVADGHVLYCRAPDCNRTLKTTQRLCDRCGTDQSTGKAASSKTLSQKNRDRADKWKCTLGLDRCLEAYKEAWKFGKTLTPNDIAECVWLVRTETVRADEQTEKNRKAAILVETTNASGNKVMVPGGSPRYKAGTKEVMITLPNYASLESDFRTVVLQQKWRGAENGAKKRERTEARERDEKKDVREFLRGVWNVFTGDQADEKILNRCENEKYWKRELGEVQQKGHRWCLTAFQATLEHTKEVMADYLKVHPHVPFSIREDKIAVFIGLGWLVKVSNASALHAGYQDDGEEE